MSFQVSATQDRNTNADTAWACTVYSMVPYLGILFVPVALALSGFGFVRVGKQSTDQRSRFGLCLSLSVLILAVQVLLWWLLYFIPTIGI